VVVATTQARVTQQVTPKIRQQQHHNELYQKNKF
jgi:hypothetical protein